MEIKKENGKVITTMSFSEVFFGYDDPNLSNEIINSFAKTLYYLHQLERTSEKDHFADFGKLICDVPNTPTKGSESTGN